MNEEQIKELLLVNFCDGDSWNDAKADHFTHEGALEIAKFYYNAGVEEERERIWKEVNTPEATFGIVDKNDIGGAIMLDDLKEIIHPKK
jgi:hypothetical protein